MSGRIDSGVCTRPAVQFRGQASSQQRCKCETPSAHDRTHLLTHTRADEWFATRNQSQARSALTIALRPLQARSNGLRGRTAMTAPPLAPRVRSATCLALVVDAQRLLAKACQIRLPRS